MPKRGENVKFKHFVRKISFSFINYAYFGSSLLPKDNGN